MALTAAEKIDKIQAILGDWFSWLDIPIMLAGLVWSSILSIWNDPMYPIWGKVVILVPTTIAVLAVLGFWAALSPKHGPFKGALMVLPVLSWVMLKAFGKYTLVMLTLGLFMGAAGMTGGRRR